MHFPAYDLAVTPLIALDLSAAFDTVNHGVLLKVLQNRFGIKDLALNWFRSYLSNRKITVQINDCFSDELDLPFSVPQGSCAGPVLFNMYASTLFDYTCSQMLYRPKGIYDCLC